MEKLKELFTFEAELLNGRVAMMAWLVFFIVDGVTRLV